MCTGKSLEENAAKSYQRPSLKLVQGTSLFYTATTACGFLLPGATRFLLCQYQDFEVTVSPSFQWRQTLPISVSQSVCPIGPAEWWVQGWVYSISTSERWDVCCGFMEERLPLTIIELPEEPHSLPGQCGGSCDIWNSCTHFILWRENQKLVTWFNPVDQALYTTTSISEFFYYMNQNFPSYMSVWIKFSFICNIKIPNTSILTIRN